MGERIPFDAEKQALIRSEIGRTGVELRQVFEAAEECPAYFSKHIAQACLRGDTQTILTENWTWLVKQYRQRPTRPKPAPKPPEVSSHEGKASNEGLDPISEEVRQRIDAEVVRTGISPAALLKEMGQEKPKGLTAAKIHFWRNGAVKSANPVFLETVLQAYEALPDVDAPKPLGKRRTVEEPVPDGFIALTPRRAGELAKLRKKTGVSPFELFAEADDAPDGLTASHVNTWLHRKVDHVREEHWRYVIGLYRCQSPYYFEK